MATQTTHYNLIKPGGTDSVDISVLNGNFDTIDDQMYANNGLACGLADQYSTSASYAVGDWCIYNNVLYCCAADTSGSWDASKWYNPKLANVVKSNSQNIASLGSSIGTLFGNYSTLMGMVWNLTRSLAPQYDSTKSYVVGDVCMNQQVLCRCIGNTSGDWDNSKWETVYLVDLL